MWRKPSRVAAGNDSSFCRKYISPSAKLVCRAMIFSRSGQVASGYAWFSPGRTALFQLLLPLIAPASKPLRL